MQSDNKDNEFPTIQKPYIASKLIKIKSTDALSSFLKRIGEGVHKDPMCNLSRFDYHLDDEYWEYKRKGEATRLWFHHFPIVYKLGPNATEVNQRDGHKVTDDTFADVIAKLKANAEKNEKGEFVIQDYLLQVRMEGHGCWEVLRLKEE